MSSWHIDAGTIIRNQQANGGTDAGRSSALVKGRPSDFPRPNHAKFERRAPTWRDLLVVHEVVRGGGHLARAQAQGRTTARSAIG